MIRYALGLALALASAPAQSGVGGEIAYSVGREIYLMNPDGTGKRLVYRGAAKTSIFGISIKHGGGELSFEEVETRAPNAKLKTIAYGPTGLGVVTRDIHGVFGERFDMDMGPDGSVLYTRSPNGDLMYDDAGQAGPVSLGLDRQVSKVAWLPDGTFLYGGYEQMSDQSGLVAAIWRGSVANPAGESIVQLDCIQSMNTAHGAGTAEALVRLGDACSNGELKRLTVSTKTLSAGSLGSVQSPAYSSDDKCYVYMTPKARGGAYLKIQELDGTRSMVIGGKANYGSVDWRGDASPSACPAVPAVAGAFEFRSL